MLYGPPLGTQYTGVTVSSPALALPATTPPWKVSGGDPSYGGLGWVAMAEGVSGPAEQRQADACAHWMPPILPTREGRSEHAFAACASAAEVGAATPAITLSAMTGISAIRRAPRLSASATRMAIHVPPPLKGLLNAC